jgi:hypothetical protein
MAESPVEGESCNGSGQPSDVVDDVTEGRRSYMCAICGAAMTEAVAASHPSRLPSLTLDPRQTNVSLQRAVELMMAWRESDDSARLIELVSADLGLALLEGRLVEDAGELIAGLVTLSALLLHELEQTTGESMAVLLRVARWVAGEGESSAE